ncbi:MAG TPA: ABC transporter substrate-binding protein [Solirubrobacterales bacterium]|nr:ABC transporter substrate-binding protein [Solirubrobacterales bacterium]
MDRRTFLATLAGGLFAAPLAAAGRQNVSRVGYLEPGVAGPGTPFFEAFRQGLTDLGWVEGQTIAIELRAAEGHYERLPSLAAQLVHLNVDVIFASSTPAAVVVKRATKTIPIVFGRCADPVGSGLVTSLARPGGNVTGWTHEGLELRVKYLDLLKDAVPQATHIGIFWNPGNPVHGPSLKSIEAAARTLTLKLLPVPVRKPDEIEGAFSMLARQRVQALIVFQDGMFLARRQEIIAGAAMNRLPAMYGTTEFVKAGGLMGYGVNLPEMYRHGASFVDKILRGTKPADLPVEQPTTFELVINLKTAQALGLTIPPSLLQRADQVIE